MYMAVWYISRESDTFWGNRTPCRTPFEGIGHRVGHGIKLICITFWGNRTPCRTRYQIDMYHLLRESDTVSDTVSDSHTDTYVIHIWYVSHGHRGVHMWYIFDMYHTDISHMYHIHIKYVSHMYQISNMYHICIWYISNMYHICIKYQLCITYVFDMYDTDTVVSGSVDSVIHNR